MQLIIKILKDSFDIILVIFICFLILFNPYVRPKQVVGYGYWSIQKREHRLMLGLTGHTFIELRDANDKVIAQLHGLATDKVTNKWKEVGDSDEDYLKVWEFDQDKYKEYKGIDIGKTSVNIVTGKEDEMRAKWQEMVICGVEINKVEIKYPKYGFKIFSETENSNSVAHSLLICAGLKDKEIGLITPGGSTDLIK